MSVRGKIALILRLRERKFAKAIERRNLARQELAEAEQRLERRLAAFARTSSMLEGLADWLCGTDDPSLRPSALARIELLEQSQIEGKDAYVSEAAALAQKKEELAQCSNHIVRAQARLSAAESWSRSAAAAAAQQRERRILHEQDERRTPF